MAQCLSYKIYEIMKMKTDFSDLTTNPNRILQQIIIYSNKVKLVAG